MKRKTKGAWWLAQTAMNAAMCRCNRAEDVVCQVCGDVEGKAMVGPSGGSQGLFCGSG